VGLRVSSTESIGWEAAGPGVERSLLVPPERGSELALDALRLRGGASLELVDALHDSLLFVHAGSGTLDSHDAAGRCGIVVPAGVDSTLRAGEGGLEAVRATIGAATDLHAPMGTIAPVVPLAQVEPGTATGARSFEVLHGPANGSTRGTAFVGHIPPGKAPWHYHLYDEIVWVVHGQGRLHVADLVEDLAPGSAFRLHAREVHIVENLDPERELVVLGVFTPAGSPSAAYLEPGVAASYVIA
jgi:quercetin dioxygenase-like cupin family protein